MNPVSFTEDPPTEATGGGASGPMSLGDQPAATPGSDEFPEKDGLPKHGENLVTRKKREMQRRVTQNMMDKAYQDRDLTDLKRDAKAYETGLLASLKIKGNGGAYVK